MNRNYKVIWSEALNCFMAVAEHAKSRGKSSSSVISSTVSSSTDNTKQLLRLSTLRSALVAVGFSTLALGMSSQVFAAVGINGGTGTGNGTAISNCTGADQANSGSGQENIAIGCASFTNNVSLRIADRGNPYYTNTANSDLVDEADRNEFSPRAKYAASVAIGTGAKTEGTFGIALGGYATTTDIAGVAIGAGSLSKGNTALAIGRQSAATADYAQAMGNVAAATGKGSLAVGHSATATGYRAIAIGATDIEGASTSHGQQGANYQAAGQTKATANDTIAFGSGAQATAENALALGTASSATSAGSVAIGSGSTTSVDANSVTSVTIDGVVYGNFAGATNIAAGDQVSVGAVGAERQVKNVAAGNISASSTDAINGSQLFSVTDTLNNSISTNTTNISNAQNQINKGINFGDGTTNNNFALGKIINVRGDNNITSTTTKDGVQIALNPNIDLGATGSVTTGNSLLNNNGLTLTGGTKQTVRLSNNGLNNGGNKITNVAAGTNSNDAVNFGQLQETNNNVANNTTNITNNNTAIENITNGTAGVVRQDAATGNITVGAQTGGTNVNFAGTDGDRVLSGVAAGNIATGSKDAVNGGQLNATADSIASVIGGNATNVGGIVTTTNIGGTGKDTIDGAIGSIQQGVADTNNQVNTNTTNIKNNTTNIADNKDRLDKGLNFGADNVVKDINKPIGDPDALRFEGGNNITTTSNGINNIKFDLNGKIKLDSVTTGNTTVNNQGVTIKDGPSMTVDGIYAGNKVIAGVADGVVNTDGVNLGQLNAFGNRIEDNINSLGYKIGDVEDNANAGISAAMAMSSLPQAYIPGKSMVGGGIATYNGESAVAVGMSRVSDNGRWVMKINGSADTQGNAGGAIGAGFHF